MAAEILELFQISWTAEKCGKKLHVLGTSRVNRQFEAKQMTHRAKTAKRHPSL